MVNIIVELSKYLIIILIIMYTYLCFTIFGYHDMQKKQDMLRRQNILMFLFHLIAFLVLYLEMDDIRIARLYLAQVVLFGATILLYTKVYPRVSRLVVNNMCMLLCVGLVMLTRLDYGTAMRQFVFAAAGIALSLVVPVIIRKVKGLAKLRKLYAIAGMAFLAVVAVLGQVSYGAKLGFSIGGISIQPSELVKIIFVFYVAASLKESVQFKNVVITTMIAALHVLILVISTDLGAALIIFVVYLVMLYVATRQPLYMLAGVGAGACASVAGYYLFAHVRTRVNVWRDPFGTYENGGYQVAQSLFAIGPGAGSAWGCARAHRRAYRCGTRISSFQPLRRSWACLCPLSHPYICELLHHVPEHCHAAPQPVLQAGGAGAWHLLHFPGVSEYRRRDQIHSVYRRDAAPCQLRGKLHAQHADHVCDHPGTLHFKRGRGRKH